MITVLLFLLGVAAYIAVRLIPNGSILWSILAACIFWAYVMVYAEVRG